MSILVTGGAGYIGSHMVRLLRGQGHEVVIVDNLVTGRAESVSGEKLYVMDLHDTFRLTEIMRENGVTDVIHFAASTVVPESMSDPLKYYHNNVGSAISLLSAMVSCGVKRIVFSSTAAVYGEAEAELITEDMPTLPKNVYGTSKLAVETMLRDVEAAHGVKSVCMRYFNVCGAHPSGEIGEAHNPETHIIPLVLQTLLGLRPTFSLYGTDYPTPDGTCIRDYVHVMDLCAAHLLALNALRGGAASNKYNLGSGSGYSNREIIEQAQAVTGLTLSMTEQPRRAGDPAKLVASSDKIMRELGWRRQYESMSAIIETAWNWHKNYANK